MESVVFGAGVATAGWASALLARPAFLQTGAAWRSRGVASGLFVLGANRAAGTSHLLDWAGRLHTRERLLALRSGEPQMAGPAKAGFGGRIGREPAQFARGIA